jgi:competence protein ComFC
VGFTLFDALLSFFYPPACPACLGRSEHDGLCEECSRSTPWLGDLPAPAPLVRWPVVAACRYAGVVRDLVLAMKFGRDAHPATALGLILADALGKSGFARDADSVVPMPLSRKRLRERGFNQAERIGAVVAARLGVPLMTGLLARPVHRPPQVDLGPEERATNVRGVFSGKQGVFGRAVLLLDDVITTGHTIAEAAAALEAEGARRVMLCAVAASGWERPSKVGALLRRSGSDRGRPSGLRSDGPNRAG